MAEKTIEKFLARAVRLYEQELEEPFGSPQLGLYVRRWVSWVNAGLKNINVTASLILGDASDLQVVRLFC